MNKKIWVVEDNEDIAQMIHFLLEDEGYQVRLFADAASFRTAMGSMDADLLVMDVMLPDGNGIDLCRELHDTLETRPPILMMSANTAVSQIRHFCHVQDFIPKPFDIDHFVKKVDRLLGEVA